MRKIHTQPVRLNDKETAKLISTYKKAYKQVVKEIVTVKDFRIRTRRQTLSNIREILVDLKVDIDSFIENEIETLYKGGALDAIRELKYQGADVAQKSTFNRIHQGAINSLVTETQEAFGLSMQGVMKDARFILGKSVRDAITARLLEGKITGKVRREIRNNIVADLKETGLTALVDKGGRKWSLEAYTNMLISTKGTEARNRGTANRLAELGYDTVLVSTHHCDCDECRVWEGRVLSLTGETKGYPTVADATSAGLFHPNCKHAINAFVPELNENYREPTKIKVENLDD